jgi:catechol 2,3-dioxygenase-like lactoylglutathione lyase family enzyme
MSTNEVRASDAAASPSAATVDMKLEVVVIPVSDVDRAKEFYSRLGWRIDADRAAGNNFRLVQFTPPGSGSSIQFGVSLTTAPPGSAQAMLLAVADIEAARKELIARGVDASEVFHCDTGTACRFPGVGTRISGPHPERLSYSSFVSFSDPDGNGWLLQEVTQRLPGRAAGNATYGSAHDLAQAMIRAAKAHEQHEARTCRSPWPDHALLGSWPQRGLEARRDSRCRSLPMVWRTCTAVPRSRAQGPPYEGHLPTANSLFDWVPVPRPHYGKSPSRKVPGGQHQILCDAPA